MKTIKLLVVLLFACMLVSFTSCKKDSFLNDGIYTPKKKISQIKFCEDGSTIDWQWGNKLLDKITYSMNWGLISDVVLHFNYNDNNSIDAICVSTSEMEDYLLYKYIYEDNKISSVKVYYNELGATNDIQTIIENGELLNNIKFTYFNKRDIRIESENIGGDKRLTTYCSNVLEIILPFITPVNELYMVKNMSLSNIESDRQLSSFRNNEIDVIEIKYDGKSDNPSYVSIMEVADDTTVYPSDIWDGFNYDNCNNPLYAYYVDNIGVLFGKIVGFNIFKNNITKVHYKAMYDEQGDEYISLKYDYDGKFPVKVKYATSTTEGAVSESEFQDFLTIKYLD